MHIQLPTNGTIPTSSDHTAQPSNAPETAPKATLTVDQLRSAFGAVVEQETILAAARAAAEGKISDILRFVANSTNGTGPYRLPDGRKVFVGNREGRYFLKVMAENKAETAL